MSVFSERLLLVISDKDPGLLDLAGRAGLAAEGLKFPLVITDREELLPSRVTLMVGAGNRHLPPDLSLPTLKAGYGGLISLPGAPGAVIWGGDAQGQTLACRWAASTWSGDLPSEPLILGPGHIPSGETAITPAPKPRWADWPTKHPWRCLSQTFTIEGLLGSTDNLFPDDTWVDLHLHPDLSLETFAKACEFAARIGLESNGLRFPLSGSGGTVVRVGLEEGDGWVRLKSGGLSLGAGPNLDKLLEYMIREFPQLPGVPPWLCWNLTAAVDTLDREEQRQPALLHQASWEDKGEVVRLWEVWHKEVVPSLEARVVPGTCLRVEATISEPPIVRESVKRAMLRSLKAIGFPGSSVRVRPAFKQGFHWLVGDVLPYVKRLQPEEITVRWRPMTNSAARDLPLRWLQETYPADEILSRELRVPIHLEAAKPEAASALTVEVFRGGHVIWSDTFTPAAALRPYLDGNEEWGHVCHPTGWLKVKDPLTDCVFISQRLPTDLERFWDWFSGTVLTDLENLAGTEEPLFGGLSVEYTGSEPEETLGVRQEIDSTLEALHEDIYFATLERLHLLGKKKRGKPFEAPGAILPMLGSRYGEAPKAQVRVTAPVSRRSGGPCITGIQVMDFLLESGALRRPWVPPSVQISDLDAPGFPLSLSAVERRLSRLQTSSPEVSLRVSAASRSMDGRPVYAVEMVHLQGDLTSPARSSLLRPTLLLNARHHGNEVSSTSAVLDLLDELAERPDLLNRVNLVAIPLENVDGAEIHRGMARRNPTWKLHAARYNRDGYEFYSEYFKSNTLVGEAKALNRLWRTWLPDMVLDAHGIPSHEWVQFFSGYGSPPRFPVSYWLPNALIYGVLYETKEQGNIRLGLDLARNVAEAMKGDREIHSLNRVWLERYLNYGHCYLPDQFPLELIDDTVFYRRPATDVSFNKRHPGITAVHCVTEVADETACGEYLGLCARAHRLAQQAALDWLAHWSRPLEELLESTANGGTRRRRYRRRPQEEMTG